MCIRSISTNEFNLMMKKTDKRVHKEIKKSLDEELGQLEDRKKGWIQEIDDLDNRKEWVDWIGKYGEDNLKRFKTPTTELLEGFIDEIVVTPTFDKNRDGKRVQVGHKLNVNFSQPIVNDKIAYVDDKNRSKGYNLVKGKKKSDIGTVVINKGGRGKKKDC